MKEKTPTGDQARAQADAHDLERLNAVAEQLNLEAADVLEYQSIEK
jgi:hypothetical protein